MRADSSMESDAFEEDPSNFTVLIVILIIIVKGFVTFEAKIILFMALLKETFYDNIDDLSTYVRNNPYEGLALWCFLYILSVANHY